MKKLLYVCEADSGGIMEYAIRQSGALAKQGAEVLFLCRRSFPKSRLSSGIKVIEFEKEVVPFWVLGKWRSIWRLTIGARKIARQIYKIAEKTRSDAVLFSSFKEYFAPFWVGPLRRLAKRGVVIGTIAHDPVRDFVVGPLWWHRWCVRLGYSFVRDVFVHDETLVDFGGKKPEGVQVHQIPHGPYEVAEPKIGREAMRRRFGFDSGLTGIEKKLTMEDTGSTEREAGWCLDKPSGSALLNPATSDLARDCENTSLNRSVIGSASSPATSDSLHITSASPDIVFLAFGQIRDGKNLDLFLRAMTRLPAHVKLLVAGKGDSGTSRPPEYYQKLAEELGIGDRCRWDIRRIPDEEVGDIFAACDFVLVTYSARFRSASGVLNAAVSVRKRVLASAGAGPLRKVVEQYKLGVFVEPDDFEEILMGASELGTSFYTGGAEFQPIVPDWDGYLAVMNWQMNGYLTAEKLFK